MLNPYLTQRAALAGGGSFSRETPPLTPHPPRSSLNRERSIVIEKKKNSLNEPQTRPQGCSPPTPRALPFPGTKNQELR